MDVNVSSKAKDVFKSCDKASFCETGLLQDHDKLVKFFEILMQIDKRQKHNQTMKSTQHLLKMDGSSRSSSLLVANGGNFTQ